jgi:N-acetyl-anhydromuramyl-L-alanine amidase AmpD
MDHEITQAPSPNHRPGRSGRRIIGIVNHVTAGLFPGCLHWMQNPAAKAASNYLVTRAGEIYQLVRDEDAAYHAGEVHRPTWPLYDGTNPNNYTLGIEHEGFDGALTEAQYQASLWLQRMLCARWGIPADRRHIIGHCELDTVNRANDPGPRFPWDRLMEELNRKGVKVVANGRELEGVIINDRSYTPVRALCEALGDIVQWDEAARTVVVTGKGGADGKTGEA